MLIENLTKALDTATAVLQLLIAVLSLIIILTEKSIKLIKVYRDLKLLTKTNFQKKSKPFIEKFSHLKAKIRSKINGYKN